MLPGIPPQHAAQRRFTRPALLRLALVVAAVAAVFGAMQGFSGQRRWYAPPEALPLEGDILYRAGMLLRTVPVEFQRKLGIEAEDLLQSGIGVYERLALRKENPSPSAMVRLAIIYSKRGYPDQGRPLLDRLVTLDGVNAPLYFALSSVYDTGAVNRADLTKAASLIRARRDWVTRLALADCLRRAGDPSGAAEVNREIDRRTRSFAWMLASVGLIYTLVLLVGAVLLGVAVWRRLFTLPPEEKLPTPRIYWTALESVEATAVLVVGMVFAGLLAGSLVHSLDLEQRAPWAVPLGAVLTYLLFSAPALILILRRTARSFSRPLHALGFAAPLRLHFVLTGLGNYCMFLAGAALLLLFIRSAGLSPLAARSPVELLQSSRGLPDMIAYFTLICILAPLIEETIFRGYVYAGLRTRFAMPVAAVLSAIMFASAHLSTAPVGLVAVAVVGLLLAYLYERTRSLWPGIVVHSFHNLLALLVILGAGM